MFQKLAVGQISLYQPSLHLISPFNNLAERKPIKVGMLAMTYENVQCQLLSGKYIVNIH